MKREAITHPKMDSLVRRLGCKHSKALARGILEGLWHLAGQHAADGDLSRFSAFEIAVFVGWDDDAEKLVNLLVDTRWLDRIDGRLNVHDWSDHADGSVHKKLARSKKFFADGKPPILSHLGGPKSHERRAAEDFYRSAEAPRSFHGTPKEFHGTEPEPRQSPAPPEPEPLIPPSEESARGNGSSHPTPDDLLAVWRELCVPAGLPDVLDLDAHRKTKARARLKKHPDLAWWRDVFQRLGESSFHTGGGKTGWRADWDWITKNDRNAARILEHAYSAPAERPYTPA